MDLEGILWEIQRKIWIFQIALGNSDWMQQGIVGPLKFYGCACILDCTPWFGAEKMKRTIQVGNAAAESAYFLNAEHGL